MRSSHYKKIKKSPRYIAGGLKRIFVVIEITKCFAIIFGCDWLNSSPQTYSKSTHIKYILKSFIFVFFGASTGLVLDLILKISSNNFSPKITLNLHPVCEIKSYQCVAPRVPGPRGRPGPNFFEWSTLHDLQNRLQQTGSLYLFPVPRSQRPTSQPAKPSL
jgi:hypothetical protein